MNVWRLIGGKNANPCPLHRSSWSFFKAFTFINAYHFLTNIGSSVIDPVLLSIHNHKMRTADCAGSVIDPVLLSIHNDKTVSAEIKISVIDPVLLSIHNGSASGRVSAASVIDPVLLSIYKSTSDGSGD